MHQTELCNPEGTEEILDAKSWFRQVSTMLDSELAVEIRLLKLWHSNHPQKTRLLLAVSASQ